MKRFAYLVLLCQFTFAFGKPGAINMTSEGIQAKLSNETNPMKYNDTYFDYGYSGNILILGMRFGIPFK